MICPSLPGTLDERARRLVVDGCEAGQVDDELVQQRRLQLVGLLGDERLLGQDHLAGRGRVRGQEAPVDEPAVAEVRVVRVLRGEAEHLLDELLRVRGLLEEELDDRRQQLQLDLKHNEKLLGMQVALKW